MDILHFLDRMKGCSEMNFSNSSQWAFLKLKAGGSSVGVANGCKLEIDVYGEVVGSQNWEGAPFACGN